MTQLGAARDYRDYRGTVYSHVTALNTLPVNSVVRNGCDSDDVLDRGVYFIKSAEGWFHYNPLAASVDKTKDYYSSDQLFLPVEQVSAQRLMQHRADLKLSEEVAGPVRKKFEQTLSMNGWYRKAPGDCDCYDDDCHDEGCFDGVSEMQESVVAAAWLAAVKQARAQ